MRLDPRTTGGRVLPLPALPAGAYSLRLALEEGEDERVVSRWHDLVIDPNSVEFRDPRVDIASLAAIASATGGRLLGHDELETWAEGLDLRALERTLTARLDLWGSIWLFLPLLGLLALEWALRKRWGLV
jgi:hypothetical protein